MACTSGTFTPPSMVNVNGMSYSLTGLQSAMAVNGTIMAPLPNTTWTAMIPTSALTSTMPVTVMVCPTSTAINPTSATMNTNVNPAMTPMMNINPMMTGTMSTANPTMAPAMNPMPIMSPITPGAGMSAAGCPPPPVCPVCAVCPVTPACTISTLSKTWKVGFWLIVGAAILFFLLMLVGFGSASSKGTNLKMCESQRATALQAAAIPGAILTRPQ